MKWINGIVLAWLVLQSMGCSATGMDLNHQELQRKARQYYSMGDLVAAEGQLRAALELQQRDPDSWFLLGNIYIRTQQYLAAQRAYQQAARWRPEQPEIWHNLALSHLRQATLVLLDGQQHHDSTAHQALLEWLMKVQTGQAEDAEL